MKTKLFILIFIISSFRIFASNSLDVTYKTDNIRINYFLGYQEEIFLPDISENEKYFRVPMAIITEQNSWEIIYQNTLGKEDKTYQIVKKTGIEIDSYLEYKSNAGDTKASISNSLKNTNNISENQKLLIIGLKYSLENSEKKQLAHYINSLNIRKTEKIEIYSKLKGFTVNDNGTINW